MAAQRTEACSSSSATSSPAGRASQLRRMAGGSILRWMVSVPASWTSALAIAAAMSCPLTRERSSALSKGLVT